MRERNGGGYRELEREIIEQSIEDYIERKRKGTDNAQPIIGEAIPAAEKQEL